MKNSFISGTRLPNNVRKIETFKGRKKYVGFFNELNQNLDLNDKVINKIILEQSEKNN